MQFLRNEFKVLTVIDDNNTCTNYFVFIDEYKATIDLDKFADSINERLEELKNLLLEDLDYPFESYVDELSSILISGIWQL